MFRSRLSTVLALAMVLTGCSGGGGGTSGSTPTATTPTPAPSASATSVASCTLRDRQDWAAAQLREWYLFPDTLPATLDPTPYTSVSAYIDALTATARAQRKDRFFTYLTSIAGEDAFYASGSSAGFGFRLSIDATARRAFVAESFEGTSALNNGVDRGAEIIAIGTSANDLRTVASIIAAQGGAGVTDALGPSTTGTLRVLRVTDASGTRDVTLSKADYALAPVSIRYGAQILTDAGQKVGYLNLRTFISTADPALRSAFASFRAAGVTNVIVDMRYNGGGLVSIAELMSNLLGANRSTANVIDYMTFRPEKSSNNTTAFFVPQPESIAPTRVAFIGTTSTASASELVIAAQIPYLRANAGLIGTNTFGKPVGQIALDRAQCDDRLRVIAFALQNADRQGAYYDGLASIVPASCQAGDDLTHPLGSPLESSTRAALDFIAGRSCTPIAGTVAASSSARSLRAGAPSRPLELLTPDHPDTVQREVPGAF
ncbi:S41 family peptidase [Sphingomonas sp. RB3P16]|uniref:S41 family peptidase n=1 Tax=Parasphingomonas frigoris TaxID=3096163 RepID=UPI002FC92037